MFRIQVLLDIFFQAGRNDKTGEQIADMIISRLHEHAIDLKDCRGQGYDNGAHMSGRIKVGAANIKALSEEIKLLREKWPTLLSKASLVADCMGIPKDLLNAQQLRQRRSKHPEAASPEEHFKITTISEENLVASTEELIAAYPEDLTSSLLELSDLDLFRVEPGFAKTDYLKSRSSPMQRSFQQLLNESRKIEAQESNLENTLEWNTPSLYTPYPIWRL
ncbi:unnamed protein product [Ranitomeya imitator]|uniref:DUF4371 domain-containing protein n=1 Tax=Ranitomeya imitator TaxID=111125 RepID=A0ABN9LHR0_9NEOB|nr:unnamed protein product [Ranitomeya imitator]